VKNQHSNRVSVVIPVFNQVHLTQRCLESLFKNSTRVQQITVINNGSKDKTIEALEDFRSQAHEKEIEFDAIHNAENLGFGRACNQGIRKSTGDYVMILNNDTWLMPAWDHVLLQAHQELRLDCVGPYFYEGPFDETEIETRAKNFIVKNAKSTRHHFVPILMSFTRKAIDELKLDHGGIFDERFFVTYEDTDLKERMERQSLSYAQTGACFIWHHSMGTRNAKGMLPVGYEQEGLEHFIKKWGFDPRTRDHTLVARLRRRLWKIKEKFGRF